MPGGGAVLVPEPGARVCRVGFQRIREPVDLQPELFRLAEPGGDGDGGGLSVDRPVCRGFADRRVRVRSVSHCPAQHQLDQVLLPVSGMRDEGAAGSAVFAAPAAGAEAGISSAGQSFARRRFRAVCRSRVFRRHAVAAEGVPLAAAAAG